MPQHRPTTDDKLQNLGLACFKANPDVMEKHCHQCKKVTRAVEDCPCEETSASIVYRTIRLADMILTLQKHYKSMATDAESRDWSLKAFDVAVLQTIDHWNLRVDSLEEQKPKTIAFLHKILCEFPLAC